MKMNNFTRPNTSKINFFTQVFHLNEMEKILKIYK